MTSTNGCRLSDAPPPSLVPPEIASDLSETLHFSQPELSAPGFWLRGGRSSAPLKNPIRSAGSSPSTLIIVSGVSGEAISPEISFFLSGSRVDSLPP